MIYPDVAQTADGVAGHYDELDIAYRRIWGEHAHHGYWQTGRENPEEAAQALVTLVERRLELSPGQQVCDIGCGYGATAAHCAGPHHPTARLAGQRTCRYQFRPRLCHRKLRTYGR